MKAEDLTKYAEILEVAKKEQRRKKFELNRVTVLEDKQIQKVNAPIVKALGENEKNLAKVINPDIEFELKNEFSELIDRNSRVMYRFNNFKVMLGRYLYISSNSSKNVIKVQEVDDSNQTQVLELPNNRTFQLFFMSPDKISGLTENDINQYIDIVSLKLQNFNSKTLEEFKNRFKPPAVTRAKGKKLLIPIDDIPPAAGDAAGFGLRTPSTIPKGIQRGKHGNLLYNNTTLMKKLQLMLAAQEAGNDGMKKDIALFLDEALKRHLIAEWEHKHNMKVFVLGEKATRRKK